MSKYNSNAGFKNYDVPSEEENQEVVSSPLSKYKTGLIFGGIAFGVIAIIIVILMLVIQNDDLSDDVVDGSSQVEVASYDYDDLFDVEPTDEDGSTISNPYDGINNNNNPQSATKPAITSSAPAQSSNSSNSSSSSSGNNSANNNTVANNSGGGSGVSNNSGNSGNSGGNSGSSNNNSGGSGGNSGGNSGGSSGNSGGSSSGSGSRSSGGGTPSVTPPKPATPQKIDVTGISISRQSATISRGSSISLSATISPSNATNKTVTWTSSNSSIATVNGGKVTGISAGRVNILAISNNGIKAYCAVTVTEPQPVVDNVSLSPSNKTIKKGSALTIRLNGASKCSWSFSNPFVTNTISSSNTSITIKGAKAGMTNVIATLPNGKTYKSKITVT